MESVPAERFGRAWAEVMLLSALWGLVSIHLWGLAWWTFGDYSGIPLMPVAAVVAPTALWFYRRSLLSLSEAIGGKAPAGRNLAAVIIVSVLVLSLLGLRRLWDPDWPTYLPRAWQWMCPIALYRVLLLAPVWGGWAMLITCQFNRSSVGTEPAVTAFARGFGPGTAAACLIVPLAGTLLYFHFLGWWRLSVPAVAILAAIAGGRAICTKSGGLSRDAMLAVNLLTQISFILAYLANR